MPANEERSISLGQLQERPMKEPTSDTEGRYGDGAARPKVRRPKPKALLYHVCSNRIELLFQNGEHKVALVRSAIKQVAKRSAIGELERRRPREEKEKEVFCDFDITGKDVVCRPQGPIMGHSYLGRDETWNIFGDDDGIIWLRPFEAVIFWAIYIDFRSFMISLRERLTKSIDESLVDRSPDPPLNPPTVRLSVLLSLKTTERLDPGGSLSNDMSEIILYLLTRTEMGLGEGKWVPFIFHIPLRTGLKASLMSYLTKLKEFQFPKQPSPKQQLEPIQLMKEDLPSRKGLKAS
ncbi:hypothetical protein Tco_1483243 [Tanacetum coccineum]